jgi:hypothetical protein
VPEYCTCGAELPPDARFCHKCGKPQREEPHVIEQPEPAPQVLTPAPAPPAAFSLALALRTALLTAAILLLLNLLLAEAGPLWLLVVGFLAVYFYRRRRGALSVRDGAKVGWISGLMSFALFGIPYIYFASRPDYIALMRDELGRRGVSPALRDRMLDALQMPMGVQVVVLLATFTLLPLLGGLIGAKLLKRRS